jgi:hypothetical protein
MGYSKILAFFALLLWVASPALIYIPNVQIDPILLYQVQVSCDRLEATLRATYGTINQNAFDYYVKTYTANYFLKLLSTSKQLAPYSNVIVGTNNTVNAAQSIIVGNSNTVVGTGNYVFSQNFNGAKAGNTGNDLVLDEWLVKLAMLQDINNYIAYANNPKSYVFKW